MIAVSILLACACSDRPAQADGAPPFPDGRPAAPADDLGAVADPVDVSSPVEAAPAEDAPPAVEIDQIMTPPAVEAAPADLDEVAGRIVYQIPPNGGPTFAEKWTAEILALLALLWVFFQSRIDVGRILRQVAVIVEEGPPAGAVVAAPVDRSEVERLQAETIAGLRQEAIDREQRIALLVESDRRAAAAEKIKTLQSKPLERLGDRELTDRLEARGRSALT